MYNINDLIARKINDKADSIRRTIEYHERNTAESIKAIEQCYLARCLLSSAGFTQVNLPSGFWDAESLTILVDKADLNKVRLALGCPLKATGEKRVVDAKAKTIKVDLVATEFPSVTVQYITKLPRKVKGKPAPKCRIQKTRHKAYTTTELVCDIN